MSGSQDLYWANFSIRKETTKPTVKSEQLFHCLLLKLWKVIYNCGLKKSKNSFKHEKYKKKEGLFLKIKTKKKKRNRKETGFS